MEETDVCYDISEQEADFEQTIALLELDTQEIEVEVQNSLEEVNSIMLFIYNSLEEVNSIILFIYLWLCDKTHIL